MTLLLHLCFPIQASKLQTAVDTQVVTRGRYMAPGTPFTDVDKPLHLHITPGACSSEVPGAPLCVHLLPLHC